MKIFLWAVGACACAFTLRGLVSTGAQIFLSLLAATLLAGGLLLLARSWPGRVSAGTGALWTFLSLGCGFAMLLGGAMALSPRAPAGLLVQLPFGSAILESRDQLLQQAVESGDLPRVERLASVGVGDPASRDVFGRPLIGDVDDPAMLEVLLAAGLDPDIRDEQGYTLLMRVRDAEIVRVLLAGGADPELRDDLGRTALMLAPARGLDVVRVLLDGGASLEARDDLGHLVADFFQPDEQSWKLLEARSQGPLVRSGSEIDLRDRGRRDWLLVEQSSSDLGPSSMRSDPETFYYGDQVRLEILLTNPTPSPGLLQVEAMLNGAAFFLDASAGGRISLPDQAPVQQEIRWPPLSLPEHSSGRLELHIVARQDSDAGDLSVDISVRDLLQHGDAEVLNLYRQMDYAPGTVYGVSGLSLLFLLLPPVAFIAWVVALKKFPAGHPHRTALTRFAAAAFALVLAVITYGLAASAARPYSSFEQTTCTIHDRRADLETRTTTSSRSSRTSTVYTRPMVAVSYPTQQGRVVSTGLASEMGSMREIERFALGAEVPCWYDPEWPESFRLSRRIGLPTLFLTLAAAAGTVALLWWLFAGWQRQRSMLG